MKVVHEQQKYLLFTSLFHLLELKAFSIDKKKNDAYYTADWILDFFTYVACLTLPWLSAKLLSVIQLCLLYAGRSREVSRLEEVLLVQAHKQPIVFPLITLLHPRRSNLTADVSAASRSDSLVRKYWPLDIWYPLSYIKRPVWVGVWDVSMPLSHPVSDKSNKDWGLWCVFPQVLI